MYVCVGVSECVKDKEKARGKCYEVDCVVDCVVDLGMIMFTKEGKDRCFL